MESKTQTGLLLLIIGSIITLIYGLIFSTSFFFEEDFEVLVFASIFLILIFIGAILILIGAILFLIGRKEFGEKHQKNVINALVIYVINFLFGSIISMAIFLFAISSIYSTSGTSLTPYAIFLLIIPIVSAVLGGLMWYFALIELEDEKGRNFLYGGIISSICVSIISSVYLSGLWGEIFEEISSASSTTSFNSYQNYGGIGILGFIPGILFIIALYIPYYRIKVGELVPQVLSAYTPAYGSNAPVRYCPNCGRGIPMDALLCPYCGKRF